MKLFHKKFGEGKPLIILHGLFGMSDNWTTLAKQFAENGFACYLVDQRNHGRSGHSEDFNYRLMADDLLELIVDENFLSADLIGHSMGGKTAMFFSAAHPDKIRKLIVVDISPRYYSPHHESVMAAMKRIDLDTIKSRKDAEELLRISLHDEATVQFLLKNLYWKEGTLEAEKKLAWRFNLSGIEKNIDAIGSSLDDDMLFDKPALFLRGEKSGYVTLEDETLIKNHFPKAQIKTIHNAGHWVHAENPTAFMEITLSFLTAK